MPTYVQLASEPEWGAQHTPPAMQVELLGPLRVFYGLGPSAVGAAGDNNHLSGRHRSYAWDRNSRYCVDRGYGTSDARDQSGDRNWYRAVDVGITGQALFDASRRMDALVRSGRAPGVAEWFGTLDGRTVAGWFQGSPSTSDSSHLFHLHVGFWNEAANDAALMQLVYATITGTAAADEGDNDMILIVQEGSGATYTFDGTFRQYQGDPAVVALLGQAGVRQIGVPDVTQFGVEFSREEWFAMKDAILNPPAPPVGGGGGLTVEQATEAAFQGAQRAERE